MILALGCSVLLGRIALEALLNYGDTDYCVSVDYQNQLGRNPWQNGGGRRLSPDQD